MNSHRLLLFCNLEVGVCRFHYFHQSSQKQKYRNRGRTQHILFLLPNTHPVCHRKTGASIKSHSAGHGPFPDVVTLSYLIFAARRSSPWTSLTIGFQKSNFLLETQVCLERTLALCRAARSESLVGSPRQPQNRTSVGVTHEDGDGWVQRDRHGKPMVLATERKE